MLNLKIIYVILTFLLLNRSIFASEIDPDQWRIIPSQSLEWDGKYFKKNIKIKPPLHSNSIIQKIYVGKNVNKLECSFLLLIHLESLTDCSSFLNFQKIKDNHKKLKETCDIFYSMTAYGCTKENNFSPFLKIFYEENIIPDSILDIIISKLPITDFRWSTEDFLELINKKLKEGTSSDEIEKIFFKNLNQIKDQKRRNKITWSVIGYLQNSGMNPDENLIKVLCQRIDSQWASYSNDQKTYTLQFIAEFSNKTGIEERYKAPLLGMLETNLPGKDVFIEAFLNNGYLSDEDLGPELQNSSVSAEYIFNLLNYIRKLRNKI